VATNEVSLIPTRILESSSFREDFGELFSLNNEQINKLATLGESENGFDLPDEELEKAAEKLQIDETKLSTILHVVEFLYAHALIHQIDEGECAEQVCAVAKKLGIEDCEAKLPAIRSLFTRKIAYEHHLAFDYAESAIIPTISSLGIACDVRVVHDQRTNKVLGYVPLVLLGMELKHSEGDRRAIQLQLSEEELDRVLREFGKAKDTLSDLKKEFGKKMIRNR